MKLLLADDEPDMIRALSAVLKHEGYEVDAVYDGAAALEKAVSNGYDGLILDIMMPKLDGLSVLRSLRQNDILTPVLLLTAKSQTEDKISGLDCGADDYLTKPFDIREFLARVRALTRRQATRPSSLLSCGNLSFNPSSMELSCGTASICLSAHEAAMLEFFLREENRLLSESQLFEHTWGNAASRQEPFQHLSPAQEAELIWTYVSYLRKKMQALGADRIINRTSSGYRLTTADA